MSRYSDEFGEFHSRVDPDAEDKAYDQLCQDRMDSMPVFPCLKCGISRANSLDSFCDSCIAEMTASRLDSHARVTRFVETWERGL